MDDEYGLNDDLNYDSDRNPFPKAILMDLQYEEYELVEEIRPGRANIMVPPNITTLPNDDIKKLKVRWNLMQPVLWDRCWSSSESRLMIKVVKVF